MVAADSVPFAIGHPGGVAAEPVHGGPADLYGGVVGRAAGVGSADVLDHVAAAPVGGLLHQVVVAAVAAEAEGKRAIAGLDAVIGEAGSFKVGHAGSDAGFQAGDFQLQAGCVLVSGEAGDNQEGKRAGGHADDMPAGLFFEMMLARLSIDKMPGIGNRMFEHVEWFIGLLRCWSGRLGHRFRLARYGVDGERRHDDRDWLSLSGGVPGDVRAASRGLCPGQALLIHAVN